MTDQQIKSGDVVQIPSSNVRMTVDFVEGRNATCVWFTDKELKQHTFRVTALVKVEGTPKQNYME